MSEFPDTPRTAIGFMAKDPNAVDRILWEKSWRTFHRIYSNFIRACVIWRFRKYNWNPSESLVDEATSNVFKVLLTKVPDYAEQRAHFHQYLRGIVWRVVWELINARKNDNHATSLDEAHMELTSPPDQRDALCEDERTCAIEALHAEILDLAKKRCSPRMAMIFHMRTTENKTPEQVAAELDIPRSTVDNEKYKFTKLLEKIAQEEPFKDDFGRVCHS